MATSTLETLLKDRLELLNKMYDCSNKLLVALQTNDFVSAERYDHLREGCWEQVRYIESEINTLTRKELPKSAKIASTLTKQIKGVLEKLRVTSQEILLLVLQTRNKLVRTKTTLQPTSSTEATPQEPTVVPLPRKIAEA